jgi:hypothetical protein
MKSTGEAIRFIKNLRDPYFRQLYKDRSMYLVNRTTITRIIKDYEERVADAALLFWKVVCKFIYESTCFIYIQNFDAEINESFY